MGRKFMKCVGRLWQRKVKDKKEGNDFLIGNVEILGQKVEIVIFYNKKKNLPTHADWNIFLQNEGMNHPKETD